MAPRWRPTVLFEEEIPALKELGVTDEHVAQMLDRNPAAWLSQGG